MVNGEYHHSAVGKSWTGRMKKMASLKGSATEKNLLASFAGESQARNRYTFFASVARKEGYEQISAIFAETADNEKEHAEVFFKYLEGGDVEITAAYPALKKDDKLSATLTTICI